MPRVDEPRVEAITEPRVELLLQHGWSYDALVWRAVTDLLVHCCNQQNLTCTVQVPDRGYFGASAALCHASRINETTTGNLPVDTLKIVMTHSFGLHLVDREYLSTADLVIIVSGFRSIHDGASPARSRKTIDRMRRGLEAAPHREIAGFHARCGAGKDEQTGLWQAGLESSNAALAAIDEELLAADLELLDVSLFDPAAIGSKARVSIISGSADAIVPPAYIRSLHETLPQSSLIEIAGAGHALPITHAETCLAPVFEELRRRADSRSRVMELAAR
ncbi:MAG TPA: alpha/beta hydrolase [Chroococcales cyanobacterium]